MDENGYSMIEQNYKEDILKTKSMIFELNKINEEDKIKSVDE
jgi:hypothetical protein